MNPTKCSLKVNSPHVKYTEDAIEANYEYATSSVSEDAESGTYFVSEECVECWPESALPKRKSAAANYSNVVGAKKSYDIENRRVIMNVYMYICLALSASAQV